MSAWEALRADPLPWLLDERQPNLVWRTLVELVGRPATSPAVERARGGASAAEPVASLLERLAPDGTWMTRATPWARYHGPGWRLVAATAWGADPEDPRLAAAAGRLLATAPGAGGFAARAGEPPSSPITARALQALARLGLFRHPRCQEALAWFEEQTGNPDPVTAVALLSALAEGDELRRQGLRDRASAALLQALERAGSLSTGHPNLLRTDPVEVLRALALAAIPYHPRLAPALERVQQAQDGQGRWSLAVASPASLPLGEGRPRVGEPSPWVTLAALVAILRYGEAASLPRLFPE